jgi:hypothetical protein
MPLRQLLRGLRRHRRPRQRFRTFPTSPRTCLAVRRHADGAEIGGFVYDRRRSTMKTSKLQVGASGSQHRGSRVLFGFGPRNHASVDLRSSLKVVPFGGAASGNNWRRSLSRPFAKTAHAASGLSSIGSTIEGSSSSGLLTRVEIGHMRWKIRAVRSCYRTRVLRCAARAGRSTDQGQAGTPHRALGPAHRVAVPSAGDGQANHCSAADADQRYGRLPRCRLAGEAACRHRAPIGCKPEGLARSLAKARARSR